MLAHEHTTVHRQSRRERIGLAANGWCTRPVDASCVCSSFKSCVPCVVESAARVEARMKLVLFGLLSLILVGIPGTASAQYVNGSKLYIDCQAFLQAHTSSETSPTQPIDAVFCTGYVEGAVDAQNGIAYNVPDGVLVRQLVDIVYKYLIDHPEERQLGAASLILRAMVKTYGKK
jgi:hypothetical protein